MVHYILSYWAGYGVSIISPMTWTSWYVSQITSNSTVTSTACLQTNNKKGKYPIIITGICAENSPVIIGFSAQSIRNAKIVSLPWLDGAVPDNQIRFIAADVGIGNDDCVVRVACLDP